MSSGIFRRRDLLLLAAPLLLGSAAFGQVVTLFSENFEGPAPPPGQVGSYTEVDPLFGGPGPTLWHEETGCFVCPTGGYIVTPNAAPFASILGSPGATVLFNSGDDGYSGRLVTPFVFQQYGIAFQLLDVSRNGFATPFFSGGGGTDFINQGTPDPFPPNAVLGPWWDDTVHTVGTTLYEVQGTAPNRQVVVEWNSLEAFPGNFSGENATFQLVIRETTNVIEFHYDNATFATGTDPWSATVGLENFSGTQADDATCLGDLNASFPATGFTLTPGVPPPPSPTPIPPICMGAKAAAYNQGDLGVYNFVTGGPNAGAIESPPIVSTSAAATLVMVFEYTRSTESGATFDQSWVETSPTGAGTWSSLAQITTQIPCTGPTQTQTILLPPALSGTSFQQRFRFDSIDGVGNDYTGWYVDNVRVIQAPGGSAVAYTENFESGTVAGVTVGNMAEQDLFGSPADVLWHAETTCDGFTTIPAPLTTTAAAYNQGDIGNYTFNTGAANEGAITAPGLVVGGGAISLTVAFDFLRQGESGLTFDQSFVDARDNLGGPWQSVLQLSAQPDCTAGSTATVSGNSAGFADMIAAGAGDLRLRFDTVDSVANAFLGWYVDNLTLTSQTLTISPTYGAGCVGAGGCAPSISTAGLPFSGNSAFSVTLANARPGASAIFLLSTAPASLPFGLFVPGNLCTLLVDVFTAPNVIVPGIPVSAGPTCAGTAAVGLPIPCSAAGATVNLQWVVIDLTVFPAPTFLSATPGLSVTVF